MATSADFYSRISGTIQFLASRITPTTWNPRRNSGAVQGVGSPSAEGGSAARAEAGDGRGLGIDAHAAGFRVDDQQIPGPDPREHAFHAREQGPFRRAHHLGDEAVLRQIVLDDERGGAASDG